MSRMCFQVVQAAESVDAEVIVEITGDCPIIDPDCRSGYSCLPRE